MSRSETSPTSTVSYDGVFDRSIYQQNRDSYKKSEHYINELLENKRERLHAVILKRCHARLEQLDRIINRGGNWAKTVRVIASFLPFVSSGVKSFDEATSQLSIEEAKKQRFDLFNDILLLEDGLDKEAIFDLESIYVLKKRFIKSKCLQDQIEEQLLLARVESVPVELLRRFIVNALNMPLRHKKLDISKLKALKEAPFLNHYSSGLQNEILMMAEKMIIDSHQENATCLSSKRSTYYFHGDPGSGKSSAIRETLKFLGIPFYVPTIRTQNDLSAEMLEGAGRTMMTHQPGFLAEALLSTIGDGQRYTNCVLILEDIDRVLLDSSGNLNTTALTFLLNYLEPEKKEYFNRYFDAEIDISRLTIVCTANKKIPNVSSGQTIGSDPFAALRSRVREVQFPSFTVEELWKMLSVYRDEIAAKYEIDNTVMTDVYIAAFGYEQIYGTLEPRSLKRRIEIFAFRAKQKMPLIEAESLEFGKLDTAALAKATSTIKALQTDLQDVNEELNAVFHN